jgi:hypothetical protein
MQPILQKKGHHHRVPLNFGHAGRTYTGEAVPVASACNEQMECFEFDITLEGKHLGTIYRGKENTWTLKGIEDKDLVQKIGDEISAWYA